MTHGVSVIVCCHNSESRIYETIQFIAAQQVPESLKWEVIIVNNASADDTILVASNSWSSRSVNASFRIVEEPVPGLSYARAKGIQEARYEILIFCDDDNHLDPNYVFEASQLMTSLSDVGVLGGWIRPKLSINPGKWVEDFYPALAIGKKSETDQYVDWVFGAGMVLRKEVYDTIERRRISMMLSDRVGKKLTSGGDDEICMIAKFVGFKVYYSNRLILDHQIAKHRLSMTAIVMGNYRNVYSVIYLYLMERLIANRNESANHQYRNFFKKRIYLIFHFLPRLFIGRHRFYSFTILYQNLQLSYWLLTRRLRFVEIAMAIKRNLYHEG